MQFSTQQEEQQIILKDGRKHKQRSASSPPFASPDTVRKKGFVGYLKNAHTHCIRRGFKVHTFIFYYKG